MLKALTIAESEEFLRQRSAEVDLSDPELLQNIEDLREYTINNKVYAMAAVQLGIPKRIVYIKDVAPKLGRAVSEEVHIVMINPVILESRGRTEFWEACRSGLGNIGLVERPYEILLRYTDINGVEKTERFRGFASTVISHELDHLDGIFHMDRAKGLVYIDSNASDFEEKKAKIREKNSYNIISKDCEFGYEDNMK
jgi:peptide deformylase